MPHPVDDGVEVVTAIVVERWECSAQRSFVRAVVFGEQTRCTERDQHEPTIPLWEVTHLPAWGALTTIVHEI